MHTQMNVGTAWGDQQGVWVRGVSAIPSAAGAIW